MKAKFTGTCRDCGDVIEVGEEITRHSSGRGWVHAGDTCSYDDGWQAESLAEQRMERWAEARFAGTTSSFWEDEDYLRDRGMGGY